MGYGAGRLSDVILHLSRLMTPHDLCSIALKEAMNMTNCDGGTIYMLENNQLNFQHVVTKSLQVDMDSRTGSVMPPVPLEPQYVCAYAVINKKNLNILDVYNSNEYDFTGTKKFDKMNNYRTGSMMVVPMFVATGEVIGVIQLINAQDGRHQWCRFSQDDEKQITAFASVVALNINNIQLNRVIKGLLAKR